MGVRPSTGRRDAGDSARRRPPSNARHAANTTPSPAASCETAPGDVHLDDGCAALAPERSRLRRSRQLEEQHWCKEEQREASRAEEEEEEQRKEERQLRQAEEQT